MQRFRVVFVLLLVVAVGLGSAAAAGAFAAPAATAQLRVDTTHMARGLPQDHPGSALMRRVLEDGSMTITPAAHRPHKAGSAAAGRSALAWWRGGHRSRVLGTALAYVTEQTLGQHRLMWLVSLNLAGGLTNPGGPSSGAPGPDNFIIVFVDANTGKVGPATAGKSGLLPPLPVIRG